VAERNGESVTDGKPLDTKAIAAEALRINLARPRPLAPSQIAAEKKKCADDLVYFINTYCQIYDNDTKSWIPFRLWPFQVSDLQTVLTLTPDGISPLYKRLIILKARQEGYTWMFGIAQKLWKMIFHPITEVLVFSQSDEEAMAVLSEERLRGMYRRLPDWMKVPIKKDNDHEVRLENGSGIRALPETRGGDSRTVTDIVIDEADLVNDLDDLLARCIPTLGENGQLVVIGRAVKKKPGSPFKRRYRAAKEAMLSGEPSEWNKVLFAPWYYRTAGRTRFIAALAAAPTATEVQLSVPSMGTFEVLAPGRYPHRLLNTRTGEIRTIAAADRSGTVTTRPAVDHWQAGDPVISMAWKDQKDRDALKTEFTLDSVYEQFPATDEEALSAASLDKRYAPQLIAFATFAMPVIDMASTIPGLRVFIKPQADHQYGIGADPAGGLTDSDDSYLCVVDAESLEQVAVLQGKIEPTQFANYATDVSVYYNTALILFELNNHGIAFLAQAKQRGAALRTGTNRRGEKERQFGWVTSERSKNALYDTGGKVFDDLLAETMDDDGELHPDQMRKIIHDEVTASQLATIDKNTLKAPDGYHDDAAMAWVLAVEGVYHAPLSVVSARHSLWKEPQPVSTPAGSVSSGPADRRFPPAFENEAAVREKLRKRGL
jgi:hypothetical protein